MKLEELNKNVIICCKCGHHEQGAEGVKGNVYFPKRWVNLPDGNQYVCPKCRNQNDVVLYGQQFISGILSENIHLHTLPHIKMSNEIWYANNPKWDKRSKNDANYKK